MAQRNMQEKVSVVIPVYNEARYISKCLKSLEKQEVKAHEIIVVDNNSTDKTREIVKKFNVRLLQEKKQGIVYARNTGFNATKGDIIARCDADMRVPPDWIKKIRLNFLKHNIDALTGLVIFSEFHTNTTFYARFYSNLIKMIRGGQITLYGPNYALTKKIWNKIKNKVCLNEKAVHEDVDLGIHIVKEGGTIRSEDSVIVESSARRIFHNPRSFFIEYQLRFFNTVKIHK